MNNHEMKTDAISKITFSDNDVEMQILFGNFIFTLIESPERVLTEYLLFDESFQCESMTKLNPIKQKA